MPFDDAKVSRDLKRHFIVQRVLGHEIDMPGTVNWQINKESAQQCWVCERKQYTFFFWSPEYGLFETKKLDWLTP